MTAELGTSLQPVVAACEVREGCITCGDVAVELIVLSVAGADASCRDAEGRVESVATEFVGDVAPGDRLLVHAGVALERLTDESGKG
jgi:hydrogenase maturation factor